MNEKIKELEVQCWEPTQYGPAWFNSTKFAELIVQECIECTKEWYEARIADSARDYSRGYVHGCDEAIAEMKKRFGVEE
jgi:hypothetical protein